MLHSKPNLTILFTLLILLLRPGVAPAQKGTLHFRHGAGSLAMVAEEFGTQFKVQLAYADAELGAVKVTAASYEAAGIGELLNKVLAPAGFRATARGNSWVIKHSETADKKGPPMVITGVIKEGSIPVSGATIIIKLEGQRPVIAVADDKGAFGKMLTSQMDGTIEVSAVGYRPLKKKFTAQENLYLPIELQKDDQQMQDVVVTALGIKREEKSLGYATTTIQGRQLTDALSGNWTDALSGKVAGLTLVRSNSGPVGTNKIILRGENNLTGDNEALIVVDGVVINQGSGRRSAISGETPYGPAATICPPTTAATPTTSTPKTSNRSRY
jgi:hypothetical protein